MHSMQLLAARELRDFFRASDRGASNSAQLDQLRLQHVRPFGAGSAKQLETTGDSTHEL